MTKAAEQPAAQPAEQAGMDLHAAEPAGLEAEQQAEAPKKAEPASSHVEEATAAAEFAPKAEPSATVDGACVKPEPAPEAAALGKQAKDSQAEAASEPAGGQSAEAACATDQQPGAGGDGSREPAPEAAVPLSRNQLKKQAKQTLVLERRAARKAEEKAAKRVRQEEKHADVSARVAAMSPEEKAAWDAQRLGKRTARKQEGQERKDRLQKAKAEGQRIIIDLDFYDKMTSNQAKSLCHQLLHAYAANGRAEKPVHLILTGLQGAMGEMLRKHAAGFENWVLTTHEQGYMAAYGAQAEKLVYLTGDSDVELDGLDPGKAYIIGGIVDRNRYKNLCLNKAIDDGIETARLPIGGRLRMMGSPILTVNQVFEILVRYGELQDWKQALEEVIPMRKRAGRDGEGCSAGEASSRDDANGHGSKKARTE